jgi:hypothetical protein
MRSGNTLSSLVESYEHTEVRQNGAAAVEPRPNGRFEPYSGRAEAEGQGLAWESAAPGWAKWEGVRAARLADANRNDAGHGSRWGKLLGHIRVPVVVASLIFGGPKKDRRFICGIALYAVDLDRRGSRVACGERRGHDDPRAGRQ